MQVQFGTDGKRINSTKIPTLTDTKTCVLKRPCSVESPVLDLSEFNPRWSVAYIPDFHRYYFVSNIESVSNSITRYYLTVDVLASFKARILAHTLNVSRSQSHGVTTQVDPYATHDAMSPNFYTMEFTLGGQTSNFDAATGTYVLQTIAYDPRNTVSASAATQIYFVDKATMKNVLQKLFLASTYDDNGQTTVDGAVKTYFNPFQYIVSCKWFPLDLIGTGTPTDNIFFGWWNSGVKAFNTSSPTTGVMTSFSMPAALDWTHTSPQYSSYILSIPGIGDMEIDPVWAGHEMYLNIVVDIITGVAKAVLNVVENPPSGDPYSSVVGSATGYWGIDILLTQLASDATNLSTNISNNLTRTMFGASVSDVAEGAARWSYHKSDGATASADPFLTTFLNTPGAIPFVGSSWKAGVTNALQPMPSMCGATGTLSEFASPFRTLRLNVRHYDVLENDIVSMIGLPCNRNLLLSNLTGYTQCNNASITIQSATSSEKIAIKNHLEGGFWIE